MSSALVRPRFDAAHAESPRRRPARSAHRPVANSERPRAARPFTHSLTALADFRLRLADQVLRRRFFWVCARRKESVPVSMMCAEGHPVHDRRAKARVDERLLPFRERSIRGDGDRPSFLALGEDLKQQFRPVRAGGDGGARRCGQPLGSRDGARPAPPTGKPGGTVRRARRLPRRDRRTTHRIPEQGRLPDEGAGNWEVSGAQNRSCVPGPRCSTRRCRLSRALR